MQSNVDVRITIHNDGEKFRVTIGQTDKDALPFVITYIIRVVILAAFPAITLWRVWVIDAL